jgi:hypothetical protein
MKRRDFLGKIAIAAVVVNNCSFANVFAIDQANGISAGPTVLTPVSEELNTGFKELLKWCIANGWMKYLNDQTHLQFDLQMPVDQLTTDIRQHLPFTAIITNIKKENGFDDFAGNQLICPGYPSRSLLYHALASPRVRDTALTAYPSLLQLDTLENYIYGINQFNIDPLELQHNYVAAVFAYQYRPALKTPHGKYADLVFSRTGIARVGECDMNYDTLNRCFTNKPLEADKINKIAVTPARFGLFLARIAKPEEVVLLKTGKYKGGSDHADRYNDSNDRSKLFLIPVRKLFNDDLLLGKSKLSFHEKHMSQKLNRIYHKLTQTDQTDFPYILHSADLIIGGNDVIKGSSFLVCSKPGTLVKQAIDNSGHRISIKFPGGYQNRYFSSYADDDLLPIEVIQGNNRVANDYHQYRNEPLYANIRYQEQTADQFKHLDGTTDLKFENEVDKGYSAALFVDNICDGCVDVQISPVVDNLFTDKVKNRLPAFSIVTAPDFFPLVDSFDLLAYDVGPGTGRESNFYEGGLASLCDARIRPDPGITKPDNSGTAFPSSDNGTPLYNTLTAVLTDQVAVPSPPLPVGTRPACATTTFLPDGCSSVFAPGWDITYANDAQTVESIYLSTKGLGSPFPEDMKLCAAMNGMWPAASPDASRTFQGSVTVDMSDYYRNPTAIPLMDNEIGYHIDSPYNDGRIVKLETFGWDGEQGPFLIKTGTSFEVNFTDLGRADYVANAMAQPGDLDFHPFNMALLRDLESAELIARMECLKQSIKKIEGAAAWVSKTSLWLVSAEAVNWGVTAPSAFGIPLNMVGTDKSWITNNALVQGKGYLFVLAYAIPDAHANNIKWAGNNGSVTKRRLQRCTNVFVCQAAATGDVKYTRIDGGIPHWH